MTIAPKLYVIPAQAGIATTLSPLGRHSGTSVSAANRFWRGGH